MKKVIAVAVIIIFAASMMPAFAQQTEKEKTGTTYKESGWQQVYDSIADWDRTAPAAKASSLRTDKEKIEKRRKEKFDHASSVNQP